MENPPAFPCERKVNTSTDPLATPRLIKEPGMTLRDYFAGQAIGGMLAGAMSNPPPLGASAAEMRVSFVAEAYRYADAMLAERAREQGPAA